MRKFDMIVFNIPPKWRIMVSLFSKIHLTLTPYFERVKKIPGGGGGGGGGFGGAEIPSVKLCRDR